MDIDIPQLKSMIDVASRAAKRARGKAFRTSLQELRTWMASGAALPVLHKSIKSPPPPVEEL
eukprot:1525014-Pyramimonas_sp.AAC.1